MGYSKEDISLLNSARGLRSLLYKGKVDTDEGLRFAQYYQELEKLQKELVQMQTHLIQENKRVIILFEGRDAAGKGGAIQRFVQFLNPRHYRIIALGKPEDGINQEWYFQRYIEHFPAPGEMVFFDRSWYNRAVIEPVNKFCSESEYKRFMESVNPFEKMITDDGIIFIKFYFSISKEVQAKRLEDLKTDPLRFWKHGKLDHSAQSLWEEYTKYKSKMLQETHTEHAPWKVIDADDKHHARLEAIRHVLQHIPERQEITFEDEDIF